MLETIITIAGAAFMATALVDILKPESWSKNYLISIAVGILIAVAYGIDMFEVLGYHTAIPHIGAILTGILISKGGNSIFDLAKLVKGHHDDSEGAE